MSNQGVKNNGLNGTGTTSFEGVAPRMHGVPDPASAGRHQAADQTKGRIKWKKTVKKIVTECWIRNEPAKEKYGERMKKIWDEIEVFHVAEQRLADQVRQIWPNKWLTDVEIEEIRRILKRKNSKVEVQENVHEIIEHNKNKPGQPKSKGHKRSWLKKNKRMSSSRKHITFVHFQKMMKY